MRQGSHCSLKWALDRYQPSLSPVIEGVSITVLIVDRGARSWARRAASNLLIAVLAELSRFVLH